VPTVAAIPGKDVRTDEDAVVLERGFEDWPRVTFLDQTAGCLNRYVETFVGIDHDTVGEKAARDVTHCVSHCHAGLLLLINLTALWGMRLLP
jgi:hypothetical protein